MSNNQDNGDAAAMREALEALVGVITKHAYFHPLWWHNNAPGVGALKAAKSALAAPPRNCDVGTAEEQCARWRKFCDSHSERISDTSFVCNCPCKGCDFGECELAWAQMPYAAEEGAGE